jgi:hypothetical protein
MMERSVEIQGGLSMLKRTSLVVSALALACTPAVWAQGNPRGEAKAAIAGKSIAIDYGRPGLKGRDMLGQAVVGTPWRMGADASTTLKTEADLAFGSAKVTKGSYTLTATKTAPDKWELNVASMDRAKIADVPLTTTSAADSVELFTIELTADQGKGKLVMRWGTSVLSTDFTGQ